MEHPEEAADILIKNAPELKDKRDFVIESQKYLSKEYASDKEKWGQFDADRWSGPSHTPNAQKAQRQGRALGLGWCC